MKSKKLPPAIFKRSRRLKRPPSVERDGIRSLLNRLQLIVPEAPKDRQLPQVQVIQHVINYICHLQDQVVQHPRFSKMKIPKEIAEALANQVQQERDPARTQTSEEPQPDTRPPS
ncbi:protein extra-macrochaetae-like [Pollicipes pollicipes]|uniref:protein extra-macrochaetae-like n=1 Tax=Pollicipes pollicipes TaxID=41117 RepID=UPI0018852DD9|nr:protein extra-macrochaetae-like [Pollicipes pollicipes]